MNQFVPFIDRAPALIAAAGPRASHSFLDFFTAQIRNPDTRRAYARAACEFFDSLEALANRPLHPPCILTFSPRAGRRDAARQSIRSTLWRQPPC
jgi:hypothetical protein